MKKWIVTLLILSLALAPLGGALTETHAGDLDPLSLWSPGSSVKAELIAYVEAVTNDWSEAYIAPADRVAVFDFDGTLYGERFPTYFDTCLFIHRALHDESYTAAEDVRVYAEALETALLNGQPEPDSPRSTAQMAAETFQGFSVDAYRAYIRDFMNISAWGFENMTYGEGFFLPMAELVQYLAAHGFKVFISSGSERTLVRVLIEGTLDEWIPSERVIGSSFSLMASGQGDKAGRSYTYRPEDEVLLEGNLTVKNQRANKVFSIVDEIGKAPILVFGNSSGDLAMAQYAVQHGGRAYMLLCDDTRRDWGDAETAAAFAETCASFGYETISMRDDFVTIYGEDIVRLEARPEAI
ncbi:MAG: haloacid dehalogenase-like hydrolase [Clostridia bacterium]|nr:haloacid dehalogenase-like hydrolase [Clostridia bacterium]